MKRQPTDAQIEAAIEWLKCFDTASEIDNGNDIAAVVAWLDDLLAQRMIRSEARRAGVPTAKLRQKLAAQTGRDL